MTSSAVRRFDRLPKKAKSAIASVTRVLPDDPLSTGLPDRGSRWLRRLFDTPARRYGRRVMIFDPELTGALCTPEFADASASADTGRFLGDTFDRTDASDFTDVLLDVDVNTYLPDCLLVKVDIATMAHGLEGRSPMLDHEFMEFAASLPADLKLRSTETKYILKQAVRDLLPRDILDRPKKGFSVPIDRWLRHELRELTGDLLLDGRLAARGYFRSDVVRRMADEHWRGVRRWHNQLWALLMLESWHRTFVDERPAAAPAPRPELVAEI
jgi:asparagine synthase (glutamine-hydrolysing)